MLCVFHNFPFPFSMSSLSLAGCLVLLDQSSNLPIWNMTLFHLSKPVLFFFTPNILQFPKVFLLYSILFLFNERNISNTPQDINLFGFGGTFFSLFFASFSFLYFYYTYYFLFCFMFHLEVYQISGNCCPSDFGLGHTICFAQ